MSFNISPENIGISSNIWTTIAEAIGSEMLLNHTTVECSAGRVFVAFTWTKNSNENSGKSKFKKVNTSRQSQSNFITKQKKKKSPSRQRRDRERFRNFLERKRLRQNNSVRKNPPVQCTPPSEVLVTVPEPPTVTSPPQPPSQEARTPVEDSPESSTVEPLTTRKSAGAYCLCDVCNRFNTKGSDTDPITEQHTECNKCGKPATFMEPLKPCSRCIICAYCSKDCQTADWSNHKQHCKKETGDQAKELRAKWYEAREVWLDHIFEPLIPSST